METQAKIPKNKTGKLQKTKIPDKISTVKLTHQVQEYQVQNRKYDPISYAIQHNKYKPTLRRKFRAKLQEINSNKKITALK